MKKLIPWLTFALILANAIVWEMKSREIRAREAARVEAVAELEACKKQKDELERVNFEFRVLAARLAGTDTKELRPSIPGEKWNTPYEKEYESFTPKALEDLLRTRHKLKF